MKSRYDSELPSINESTVEHCHKESIRYDDYGWKCENDNLYTTTSKTSNKALRHLIEDEKSKINCCMTFFKAHATNATNPTLKAQAESAIARDKALLKKHNNNKPSVLKLGLGLLMSGHAI